MGSTLAIARKETRLYLTTWTSYVLFGFFILITAFFFQRLVIEFQLQALDYAQSQQGWAAEHMNLTDWVLGPVFSNMSVFFLIMLPMLTMRLLAEERRQKTLELLMTTPVRPVQIVLGKYLAALLIMGIMLGLTVIFPILLAVFGGSGTEGASPVDWHTVGSSYLGLFLMGAAIVAIGLLTSAATESQIVAVVTGFAVLLMFWVIGLAARGQEGFWGGFLEYLSLTTHLENFVRGIIKLSDVVYYLSLAGVGLFLTHGVVDAQRWR
ncbi:MAG: ABC transporter permease [Deltaproteobacteria bacterium]|nr:ABC transporter permease [Deltaproteobacteria bacterium]